MVLEAMGTLVRTERNWSLKVRLAVRAVLAATGAMAVLQVAMEPQLVPMPRVAMAVLVVLVARASLELMELMPLLLGPTAVTVLMVGPGALVAMVELVALVLALLQVA